MDGSERDPNELDQSTQGDIPQRLAEDKFYRALASSDRRRVLYYLLEENDSTVEELATVLCGWKATTGQTMRRPADRRELIVELSHNHLPQLADVGLISYESHTGSVHLDSLHPPVADIIRQSVRVERADNM